MKYKNGDTLVLTIPNNYTNKVSAIKAIRAITSMGLKEAKDLSESIGNQKIIVRAPVGLTNRDLFDNFKTLANEGVKISPSEDMIIDHLRELGVQALSIGNDELANEILQLVLAEKLRRSAGPSNEKES